MAGIVFSKQCALNHLPWCGCVPRRARRFATLLGVVVEANKAGQVVWTIKRKVCQANGN